MNGRAEVVSILSEVDAELAGAMAKFAPMGNLHEAYAVILEELDEAWTEIKVNQKRRDGDAIRKELIQVAAMAVRAVFDCCSVETRRIP